MQKPTTLRAALGVAVVLAAVVAALLAGGTDAKLQGLKKLAVPKNPASKATGTDGSIKEDLPDALVRHKKGTKGRKGGTDAKAVQPAAAKKLLKSLLEAGAQARGRFAGMTCEQAYTRFFTDSHQAEPAPLAGNANWYTFDGWNYWYDNEYRIHVAMGSPTAAGGGEPSDMAREYVQDLGPGTDECGHIRAREFGGKANHITNIWPQNGHSNGGPRSNWKDAESYVSKLITKGCARDAIRIYIEFYYGDNIEVNARDYYCRPTSFRYTVTPLTAACLAVARDAGLMGESVLEADHDNYYFVGYNHAVPADY